MLKKCFLEQINNENHYTIPKYVLTYSKELGLDMNALILLVYFLNQKNKEIFDYKKIIDNLGFSEKELLDSISLLKDKRLLSIQMEKNELGILEEKIDVSSFYEIIFSKFLDEKKDEKDHGDLFNNFEKEFGRTLSPMEYEIINNWIESGISNDLILAALKETVFNGVNNLRYVDKILYEWNKRGIKKASDLVSKERKKEEEKDTDCYEYDWLNE
ncbi:MAG: DnaD domain protein [Bacilli bacterium]|nr:DnaD domain protein [Bacilli bacterium]